MFLSGEQMISGTDVKDFDSVEYPIMEHFYTIQGEGAHSGRAAYFIRTAGCDVKCWWCDVKDSWDASKHPRLKTGMVADLAKASGAAFVVVTGGEPLLHDLLPLTSSLKARGLEVHIETSGSSPLSGQLDWITLSPKRFKKPVDEIYPYVDELKVVVLTKKDLTWAEEHAAKCPVGTRLLLQPEWDTPKSMPLIVDYVKANPQWGISLQTHKFLNVP
ncbi:Organic radical activating enzyme [Cyclonatronum proteinivorum]|uniref:7-carboxy-7-deazaguanine synthase n=1 Tax=Cyclonatronum proteinivorum TaxID=1457365 RepID=A0A345UKQ8_9BACT|nr:7-carboxy-7-deazaguanine synthase QueE [Cyclonatronum proteinivorum]AXJ01060.1 Organic radical activating enzyme [Cyclonatronum proteinivorum]